MEKMFEKLIEEFSVRAYGSRNPEEAKDFYTEWAPNYEEHSKLIGFNAPSIAVNHFLELGLPKESNILDIGAGTGVVGELLVSNGYKNVDALDGTPEMLKIAKHKNCYKSLITSYVSSDIRLPIEDNIYDAVIMAGCHGPGHIRVEAFEQIIRVVKPGGIICWSMAVHEKYAERGFEQFRDGNFSKFLQKLCYQNKWTFIDGYPLNVQNYSLGKDGYFYAMKVK